MRPSVRGRRTPGHGLPVLLLALSVCRPGQTENLPVFSLDVAVHQAKVIVLGRLDGEGSLRISEAVVGSLGTDTIDLLLGQRVFEALQGAMGRRASKTIEAIAFLRREHQSGWVTVLGRAGVVGIGEHAVLMYQETSSEWGPPTNHPTHTRQSFLAAIRNARRVAETRDRLVHMPRSSARAAKLVALLLEQGEPLRRRGRSAARTANYHLTQIARAFTPIDPVEEQAILRSLAQAQAASDQALLLDLIGAAPLTARALDRVGEFLGRQYPAAVRQSAMAALPKIDLYRAVDWIGPLLTLDEPHLATALQSLGDRSSPPQDRLLNPKAVESLRTLSQELRARIKEGDRYARWDVVCSLLNQLAHYSHPDTLPEIRSWAFESEHGSRGKALSDLCSVTGLTFRRQEHDSWTAWWGKAEPILAKAYNLQTSEGRRSWAQAYSRADIATRRILMNMWIFESSLDESALLEDASATDPVNTFAAKAVLSELWQRKRLSPNTKKAIVQRFLRHMRLVEVPHKLNKGGTRYLRIVAEKDFPFPRDSWLETRGDCAIGRHEPKLNDMWGSSSMHGSGQVSFTNMVGGHYPGSPTARAILEIREVGRRAGAGVVLWTLRWSLGPIELRDWNSASPAL